MKKNVFGKGLVLGLVFLIVVAGITPVFGMSMVTSKEDSAAVPSDRNSLADEVEKSSNMMTVTMVKLCNDNSIKNVREKISVKEYNEYAEKIKTCNDLGDTFAVLQEYDIVPESMSLDRFVQLMNSKMNKFIFLINIFERFKGNNHKTNQVDPIHHYLQIDSPYLVMWQINPPVRNFYISNLYLNAWSDEGGEGWIKSIFGEYEEDFTCPEFIEIDMILYLGILDMSPGLDVFKASFIGISFLIHVMCPQ